MSTNLQENKKTTATNAKKVFFTKKFFFKIFFQAVVVVAIGMGVYFFFIPPLKDANVPTQFEYENNVTIGLMPGVDRVAFLAEMQKNVDESAIAFSINASPVMQDSYINIMFENPNGNNKDLVIEIFENGTEVSIYKSKAIKDGSYIENVKLNKELATGDNFATVYITAYNKETHEMVGQAAAEILIKVG